MAEGYETERPKRMRRVGFDHTNCPRIPESPPKKGTCHNEQQNGSFEKEILVANGSNSDTSQHYSQVLVTSPQEFAISQQEAKELLTSQKEQKEAMMSQQEPDTSENLYSEEGPKKLNGQQKFNLNEYLNEESPKKLISYGSPPQKFLSQGFAALSGQLISVENGRGQQQSTRRKRGIFEPNPHELINKLNQSVEVGTEMGYDKSSNECHDKARPPSSTCPKYFKFTYTQPNWNEYLDTILLWPILDVIFNDKTLHTEKNYDIKDTDNDNQYGFDGDDPENDNDKSSDHGRGWDKNNENGFYGNNDDNEIGSHGDDNKEDGNHNDNNEDGCYGNGDENDQNGRHYECNNEEENYDTIDDIVIENEDCYNNECDKDIENHTDGYHGNVTSFTANLGSSNDMFNRLRSLDCQTSNDVSNDEDNKVLDANNNVYVEFDSCDLNLYQDKHFEIRSCSEECYYGNHSSNQHECPSVGDDKSSESQFHGINYNNWCTLSCDYGYHQTESVAAMNETVTNGNQGPMTAAMDTKIQVTISGFLETHFPIDVTPPHRDYFYEHPISPENDVRKGTPFLKSSALAPGKSGSLYEDTPDVYTNQIVVQVSSDDLSGSDGEESFMPLSDMARLRKVSRGDMNDFADLKVMTQKLNLDHRRPSLVAWKEKELPKKVFGAKQDQTDQHNQKDDEEEEQSDLGADEDQGDLSDGGPGRSKKRSSKGQDDRKRSGKEDIGTENRESHKRKFINQKCWTPPLHRAFLGDDLETRPRSSSFKSPSKHTTDYFATIPGTRSLESLQNSDNSYRSRRGEVGRVLNMLEITENLKAGTQTGSRSFMSSNGSLPSIQEEKLDCTGAVVTEHERRRKVDDNIDWIRTELQEMRIMDCTLAKQLLRLREEIHRHRLQRCYKQQKEMIEDAFDRQHEQAIERQFNISDFDLPERLFDPELSKVGITRMNITSRRFSVF